MAFLLKKNEVLSIPAAQGYDLCVYSGCIWMTCSIDRQDHILKRGEKVILGKGEAAVFEALKDSCITIRNKGTGMNHFLYEDRVRIVNSFRSIGMWLFQPGNRNRLRGT